MPIIPFNKFYTEKLLRDDPDGLYIFGDNMKRVGRGGQAVIRDMPNAIGIATKIRPETDYQAYFRDSDLQTFKAEIERAHPAIKAALMEERNVYWPSDGIGTGLSALPKTSPACYDYLCRYSRALFERVGPQLSCAIVCGGRDFNDMDFAVEHLNRIFEPDAKAGIQIEIIEGQAKGADKIAGIWAQTNWLQENTMHTSRPANWTRHGRRAGFIRNSEMSDNLAARRDQMGAKVQVIGMPGGTGTKMMLKISRERGFPVTDLSMPLERQLANDERDEIRAAEVARRKGITGSRQALDSAPKGISGHRQAPDSAPDNPMGF